MRSLYSLSASTNLAALMIILISSSMLVMGANVADLRARWEGVADGIETINSEHPPATVDGIPIKQVVANPNGPKLTPTLVAWISSQSEGIVQEMEAIAKQNAESSKFSVVNYLRYLKLYDSLRVVARQPIDQLVWVRRKAKVFGKIYHAASEVVSDYLIGLDIMMSKIEAAEPKGKAKQVGKDWLELYESIRYIATHAPNESELAKAATQLLLKSPNNTIDKIRSNRYQLQSHAFNRR